MLNMMMKKKLTIISIIVILVVIVVAGLIAWRQKPKADETTSTDSKKSFSVLWGTITDEQHHSLVDIVISLGGVGTQTDAQGQYALVVPAGDYSTPIFRNANATQQYEPTDMIDSQISLQEGYDLNRDFQLRTTDQIIAVNDAMPSTSTAVPSPSAKPTPTPSPCAYNTIKSLSPTVENRVKYTYCLALGREAEAGGLAYWKGVLQGSNDPLGLVVTFSQTDEFKINNKVTSLSNEDYVKLLYRKFLLREAEPGGLAYWAGLLNGGQSRESVASQIIHSAEFAAKHSIYTGPVKQ
jgi:hypothetical protein